MCSSEVQVVVVVVVMVAPPRLRLLKNIRSYVCICVEFVVGFSEDTLQFFPVTLRVGDSLRYVNGDEMCLHKNQQRCYVYHNSQLVLFVVWCIAFANDENESKNKKRIRICFVFVDMNGMGDDYVTIYMRIILHSHNTHNHTHTRTHHTNNIAFYTLLYYSSERERKTTLIVKTNTTSRVFLHTYATTQFSFNRRENQNKIQQWRRLRHQFVFFFFSTRRNLSFN